MLLQIFYHLYQVLKTNFQKISDINFQIAVKFEVLKSMKGKNIRWYKFFAIFRQFKKGYELLVNYFIDCL